MLGDGKPHLKNKKGERENAPQWLKKEPPQGKMREITMNFNFNIFESLGW